MIIDNAKYTSPEIQNQMIAIIGTAILDEIIGRVKLAKFYAIIADETPDMSQTEQLSLLVRFVWNGEVEERLLTLMPMEETTAEVLFVAVTQELQKHVIDLVLLRGQCYDGANNVAGVHTGLQARVNFTFRNFTFCSLHSLLCSCPQSCHCGYYEPQQDCQRFLWHVTKPICFHPVLP